MFKVIIRSLSTPNITTNRGAHQRYLPPGTCGTLRLNGLRALHPSQPMPRPPKHCLHCGAQLAPTTTDEGLTRLACPDCGWIHYGNPTPVVAGLVEHEGDVLLVRNKGWPETWYGLVSGFLEAREDPAAGMLRELREELGLEGEIVGLIGVYAFEMRNELIVAYHVQATGEVVVGDELAGVKRVPPEKLRPWPMGTGLAVRDWLLARGLLKADQSG